LSTRAAAAEAKLSQTRVRQIVDRVDAFLNETTRERNEQQRESRVWLAEQIASERVSMMFGRAVRAFESETLGKPSYLLTAGRLALYGAKLPLSCIGYGTFEEEEEAEENSPAQQPVQPVVVIEVPAAQAPAETVAEVVSQETTAIAPPVRDCSLDAPKPAVAAKTLAVEIAASQKDKEDSEDDYRLAALRKLRFERPAQLEDSSGSSTSGRRLNRKQRRARMQFLQAGG
jgi:hypothetical protein